MAESGNEHLRAIVDIGSNGIRFSITSLDPSQARIIPCLFQDRAAISLFDAQHTGATPQSATPTATSSKEPDGDDFVNRASLFVERAVELESTATTPALSPVALIPVDDKVDIGEDTIADVIMALKRFKYICKDFGVLTRNIHVIATEATREAKNSKEFRDRINSEVGWTVNLLSKEDEARTGAYGVASSFYEVSGLFMDLGGGSTQLSWIMCKNGEFKMSESPISLPYGAAALTRRLSRENPDDVFHEMRSKLHAAVTLIDIPQELQQAAKRTGGHKIYVSGGGFRGLGHLILARHEPGPYPLPIINGFSCTIDELDLLVTEVLEQKTKITKKAFRISERRATQIPAVALLVSALLKALPPVRKVLFSQGGVREGALFHELTPAQRAQDPLYIASKPYAPLLAKNYTAVLRSGIPASAPPVIRERLVNALVNVAFVHSSYPKESQPNAALAVASTGILSGSHGLSHEARALLGLALSQRWGGELPDKQFKDSMVGIVYPRRLAWWASYCGHLMHVVGGVYPGGNVSGERLKFEVKDEDEKGFTLVVEASSSNVQTIAPTVRGRLKNLEKKLKKLTKECEAAMKVKVELNWVDIA